MITIDETHCVANTEDIEMEQQAVIRDEGLEMVSEASNSKMEWEKCRAGYKVRVR